MEVYLCDGQIKSTDCKCARGAYKCSRAATLFIHDIHNLSRTDVECTWKKTKTSDVPRSLAQLYPPPKDYNPLLEDLQATDRVDLYNTRDYRIN